LTVKTVHSKNSEAGFSLVELAIVLLVIGLIIGGILKGQELLESARLKSLLTQVNEYRVATSIFLEKYGALPGDYDKAKEYIDDKLQNGNGDGKIDGPGLASHGAGHEALSFWSHLAAAGLISPPGENSSGGHATFGKGAPSTRIGGGFTIVYGEFDSAKHWFVAGTENGDKGNGALLTPMQALSLDQKIDSGNPLNGQFRVKEGAGAAPNSCITNRGLYNSKTKTAACVVYFML
jgi:hypothetical protein